MNLHRREAPYGLSISFVVTVMANIVAYIVRKWIDKQSHDKIKGHQKEKGSVLLLEFPKDML